MRTYYGHAATSDRGNVVTVRDTRSPEALTHHFRHSPTGFSWGDDGSGIAELARCILLDSFGSRGCPDSPAKCHCTIKWVEPTYQAFRSDTVSKFPKDGDWKLGQEDVMDWVFDYLGQGSSDGGEPLAAVVATS